MHLNKGNKAQKNSIKSLHDSLNNNNLCLYSFISVSCKTSKHHSHRAISSSVFFNSDESVYHLILSNGWGKKYAHTSFDFLLLFVFIFSLISCLGDFLNSVANHTFQFRRVDNVKLHVSHL